MTGHTVNRSGFLDQSRHSGSGLAIVIGLHGAAIAVAFLMKSGVITIVDQGEPPEVVLIVRPQDPDPIPEQAREQSELPTPPVVTLTPVPTPLDRLTFTEAPEVRPAPPLQPVTPTVQETPEPVMVAARIHPSHRGALQPRYPAGPLRQELEGSCTIRVHIAANGRVIAAEPVRATHPAFCEATQRQALRRWRFEPATRDGVAVDSWQQHTVEFRIT
jgi:periplasmic protein TonB